MSLSVANNSISVEVKVYLKGPLNEVLFFLFKFYCGFFKSSTGLF
jgi:hypothetical protein